MKPREYLSRFGNDLDTSAVRGEFAQTLIQEFDAALRSSHGYSNIKGYEQAIRVLRAKWDSIGVLRGRSLDEKLWKFLYASYIAPVREETFPKEMAARREEAEIRKRMRQADEDFARSFFRHFFEDFWSSSRPEAPVGPSLASSLQVLGLGESYTETELKRARRIMALKHHPDVGGDPKMMQEVNVAFDVCEQHLRSRA